MTLLGELVVKVIGDITGLNKSMDLANKRVAGFQSKMKGVGTSMTQAGRAMTLGITLPALALGGAILKVGADFDSAMTESLAIMGDVQPQIRDQMEETARTIAVTTNKSATEAAESYFFLASAGLDAAQSIEALPVVARFAQAGAFDMALATDLLTDAQSALGLTIRDDVVKNMENMNRVSDVLVKANTLANATVQQFSESLTNDAAAAMRLVNKDIEEGVAVLAVFADQGLKGAAAGSSLAIVFRDLQKAAINNKEIFAEMGISVFDTNGNMRNMADIVNDLSGLLEGMSDEETKATLMLLGFQERSVKNIQLLLGTGDAMREYEEGLRGAAGTTQEVADNQMKSLSSQLGILKDKAIEVGLAFFEKLEPTIVNDLVPALSDLLDSLTPILDTIADTLPGIIEELLPQIQEFVKTIGEGADKFADLDPKMQAFIVKLGGIAVIAGPLLLVLGPLVRGIGALAGPLAKLGPVAVTAGKGLATGLGALGGGSIAAGVGTIGGVIAALLQVGDSVQFADDELGKLESTLFDIGKGGPHIKEFFDGLDEAIENNLSQIVNLAETYPAIAPLTNDLFESFADGEITVLELNDGLLDLINRADELEIAEVGLVGQTEFVDEAFANAKTRAEFLETAQIDLTEATEDTTEAIEDEVAALEDLIDSLFRTFLFNADLSESMRNAEKAFEEVEKTLGTYSTTIGGTEQDILNNINAQENLTSAQENYNKVLSETPNDQKKVLEAQIRLTNAQNRAEETTKLATATTKSHTASQEEQEKALVGLANALDAQASKLPDIINKVGLLTDEELLFLDSVQSNIDKAVEFGIVEGDVWNALSQQISDRIQQDIIPDLDDMEGGLDDINDTVVDPEINADTAQALADVGILTGAITGIPDKTVTVTTNFVYKGSEGFKGLQIAKLPHFADGGISEGGLAVVGERGREIVDLPKGARVTPLENTDNSMDVQVFIENAIVRDEGDFDRIADAVARKLKDDQDIKTKGLGVRTI